MSEENRSRIYFENKPRVWLNEYSASLVKYMQKKNPGRNYFIKLGKPISLDNPPTITAIIYERAKETYSPQEREIAFIRHWTAKECMALEHIEIESSLDQQELEKLVNEIKVSKGYRK